jgi:hypothetical protein
MQTSYNYGPGNLFSGVKVDLGPHRVATRQAVAAIDFGRGVFQQYNSQEQGRLPAENQCVILDDAGTFTAGDIVTTVNGTPITTTFGTDKDTTMTAHAAAILAGVADVYACAYSAGSHTITIQTRNTTLVVSTDVSGITGTMTITSYTNTSLDAATNFVGVALHEHEHELNSSGVRQYAANDAMSVMKLGQVAVAVEETVTVDDSVYVRTMADGAKLAGMFGKTSVAGKTVALPNCRFVRGGTTTVPAVLEINNP